MLFLTFQSHYIYKVISRNSSGRTAPPSKFFTFLVVMYCLDIFSTSVLKAILKILEFCHFDCFYYILMTYSFDMQTLTNIGQPFSSFIFWYFLQNIPEIRDGMKCDITIKFFTSTLCNHFCGCFVKWLSGQQKKQLSRLYQSILSNLSALASYNSFPGSKSFGKYCQISFLAAFSLFSACIPSLSFSDNAATILVFIVLWHQPANNLYQKSDIFIWQSTDHPNCLLL